MKNILKNKAFIILAMLIITLFVTSSKVFGYSFTYDNKKFNTIEIDKLDVSNFGNTGDFCIVKSSKAPHGYYLFLMPNDFHVKVRYRDDLKRIYLDYNYTYLKVEFGDDELTTFNSWYESSFDDNIDSVVYTTFDIYDQSNEVVFQKTPVVQGILAEVVTLEEAQEIPATIVGLAGLLIALLVCLIGFRKGWNRLSRILHKA